MTDPKILYTVIAHKKKILCEYFEQYGDVIDYIRDNVLPVAIQ